MAEEETKQEESQTEEKQEETKEEPKQEPEVKDSHGQPGINKERHDREMAAKDAEIAELKKQIAEAAKTEEGRKELEDKISKLEADQAEERIRHKLELAGIKDDNALKAAQTLIADFDNDAEKLKAAAPYLFKDEKAKGSTGLKAESTVGDIDAKLDQAFGLKK